VLLGIGLDTAERMLVYTWTLVLLEALGRLEKVAWTWQKTGAGCLEELAIYFARARRAVLMLGF
jgi:hypothetical protein